MKRMRDVKTRQGKPKTREEEGDEWRRGGVSTEWGLVEVGEFCVKSSVVTPEPGLFPTEGSPSSLEGELGLLNL